MTTTKMKSKTHNRWSFSPRNLLSKDSPYSWRSVFAFLTIVIMSTVLLYSDRISADNWVNIVEWVGGFFIVGETARKFSGAKKEETADESEQATTSQVPEDKQV